MAGLKGTPELKARLRALRLAFKPIGRQWADTTAELARPAVPVRTGRLRASFRRRNASQKRATVVGHYTATFVDGGTAPHAIKARRTGTLAFQSGGRPVFAKKVHHRGARAKPFKKRVAEEGLRRTPMAQALIDEWNGAA